MKIKQRPEDFVVREGYRFESDPDGEVFVYRMDKQKVSTLAALERLAKEFGVRRRNLSVCGLKDKQGRTEQLVGVFGGTLGETEVVQSGDLRLTLLGRTAQPLSSGNITANRFEVTVRDLSRDEAARVPESVAEVQRAGVVNYFDSQRFGFLKHGQGFIGKQLLRGDFEGALKAYLATPSDLDKSDDRKVKAFWQEHWGEWSLRAPHDAARKYAPMLRQLREDPKNFKAAFLHIDRRVRMMALFELQSYVWNEGAKRYLMAKVPQAELIGLRYQAGALVLPRSLNRALREELWAKTFPLLAPDSKFDDPAVESAALAGLSAQQLRLEDLRVPHTPQLFFKHEERPLFVVPGKLRVNEPREDELNRRRYKVNLSFTLPPGAYATLVVRRVLWFAEETRRTDEPVGRAWGRPLEESRPAVRAGRSASGARDDAAEARAKHTGVGAKHTEAGARDSEGRAKDGASAKDTEAARAAEPEPREEKPKTPKTGFLERQRRKKAEREERRKSAKH